MGRGLLLRACGLFCVFGLFCGCLLGFGFSSFQVCGCFIVADSGFSRVWVALCILWVGIRLLRFAGCFCFGWVLSVWFGGFFGLGLAMP